jgi:hypothetical protein
MTPEIGFRLMALEAEFNAALDKIHDALLAQLRSMAKSVGQRTRVDRMKK